MARVAHCRSGKGGSSVKKANRYCRTNKSGIPRRTNSLSLRTTNRKSRAGPKKMAYVRKASK